MSCLLLIRLIQDQAHGAGERLPLGVLAGKLFASQRREAIVAGALPFVGQVPRSRDPSFRLQPVERRVERAGLYLQQVLGSPLDMFGNSVTMTRSCEQRAEDQQIERALQELHA